MHRSQWPHPHKPARQKIGLFLLLLALTCTGCVAGRINDARTEFYKGQPQEAEKHLAKPVAGRDRLLYLMENGVIRHQLGQLEESTASFLEASQLIAQQEVISLSQQAGSLVTTEWMTEFKGEICERLWVHTYLMMNFLLADRPEDALVEGKQALKILDSHPESLADEYFTRALIGLCFEQSNEWNDAYIAYRDLAGRMKNPATLAPLLFQVATRLGFNDDADLYRRKLPENTPVPNPDDDSGEVILFIAQGHGPKKISGNIFVPPTIRFSFPQYENRKVYPARYAAHANGVNASPLRISTDVHRVAAASLKERAARMIAKETARVIAKEAIAQSVERKDDALGLAVRLILLVLEEPDTRSWATLPGHLTLLRVPLPPGPQQFTLVIKNYNGEAVGEWTAPEFDLQPGRKMYFSLRLTDDYVVMPSR